VDTARRSLSRPSRAARLIRATLVFGLAASLFLQSWRYGLLVTVSFALHELGHILALSRHGIPWDIHLSLLGVGTATPLDARQRLGHFANSQIHLAGPAVNLAQALFALGGYLVSGWGIAGADAAGSRENWLLVANLASLLVLLNLLPLGRLSDGGKFVRRLFASLNEQAEQSVTWSLLLWLLSVVWLIIVNWGDSLRTLGTLAVAVWFVAATLGERQRGEPPDIPAQQRLTRREGILLFSAMATALLWATGITVLTPFWLTLDHLEGMAYNIIVAVVTLERNRPLALALAIVVTIAIPARALLRRRQR
jgi:hypothetical protein